MSTLAALHSRTCGLVLVSQGRATTRDLKADGGSAEKQKRMQATHAQLMHGFLLLRDGRAGGADKRQAQELSQAHLRDPSLRAGAVAHCEDWHQMRLRAGALTVPREELLDISAIVAQVMAP